MSLFINAYIEESCTLVTLHPYDSLYAGHLYNVRGQHRASHMGVM